MTTSLLRIRTAAIETVGVTVLRFTNSDVDNHFPSVCQQIITVVNERLNR